ncbi:MAG: hypothetical protein ACM3X0_02020 [Bacteroidota bacterium]
MLAVAANEAWEKASPMNIKSLNEISRIAYSPGLIASRDPAVESSFDAPGWLENTSIASKHPSNLLFQNNYSSFTTCEIGNGMPEIAVAGWPPTTKGSDAARQLPVRRSLLSPPPGSG